ncbi:GGDEF domain-containing protein [Demequina zhanjiangensis]|uniref:Diguanylate cyclase n=1 Tax=Demequina zhanjiangensis TaxID=3051659 RepID=A0ABT8G452_9MICO|nr:diguanylate cyclase [Demequina sp. SYSU T00b26]MDN4473709.1 diguanylate cyclase [Demequina sp. SYSU T00b26]
MWERLSRRLQDPLAWVIGVALLTLAVIGATSLYVRANVADEAREITSDAVQVIGDAAAAQLVESSQPADLVLTALQSGIYADPSLLEQDQLVSVLATAMLSFDEVGSLSVEAADGGVTAMYRVPDGFALVHRSTDDVVTAEHYDPLFTRSTVVQDPPQDVAQPLEPVRVGRIARGEPEPIGTAGALAVPSRLSVYGESRELVATVQAAIDIDRLGDVLASTRAAQEGIVALYSEDGRLIAGEDITLPEGVESQVQGEGEVVVDGKWVYYVRTVSGSAGLGWTLVLCASAEDVVPAASAVASTMTAYTAVVLLLVAGFAIIAWVLRRPVGEMSLRARTDAVTGLSNRHHFEARGRDVLRAAERRSARVVVAVFDLDGFKSVNDTIGHDAGDDALRAVGDALADHVGPRDIVARTGGDEFAFVHWLSSDEPPSDAVERLRAAAERGLRQAASGATVGVSAGWAETSPGQYRLDRLMRAADEAMVVGRQDEKGVAYEGDAASATD